MRKDIDWMRNNEWMSGTLMEILRGIGKPFHLLREGGRRVLMSRIKDYMLRIMLMKKI